MFRTFVSAALCTLVAAGPASAAGYLGARAEKLEPLRIGIGDDGYGMEPKEYRIETGKGYKLTVQSTGLVECELDMREFLDSVWVRQLQAGDVEVLNPVFSVVELDDKGEFELTFVPIRPGAYDVGCRGLEDRGLVATFVVE